MLLLYGIFVSFYLVVLYDDLGVKELSRELSKELSHKYNKKFEEHCESILITPCRQAACKSLLSFVPHHNAFSSE
jgi:hypothetical protein